MDYPLAIFAPTIGTLSETFIRRHMEELLPGGTVTVADKFDGSEGGHWSIDGPSLLLHDHYESLRRRVARAAARMLGWPAYDHGTVVNRFLKTHGVRVAMGEYLDWSTPWLRVAQSAGARFFGHAHGYDVSIRLRQPRWQVEYLGYNAADGVITVSEASKARLVNIGLDATKIHVIPCGVDVPSQAGQRPERNTVCCIAVGRMIVKKAPILTLDAFRCAAEKHPELRLDYVGGGELLPVAQQFIRVHNLGDRVTLHGSQPREIVRRLMGGADVFLQHSIIDPKTGDEEGLPVSILEAMANSLPVISTYHAGIPEAVLDGSTGYLVPEGDVVGMAERLITLAREPALRRRMGEAGWCRAKKHFSWEKERAELLKLLRPA